MTKPNHPGGRPPMPPGQAADRRVSLRLSAAHLAEFEARGGVAALRVWLSADHDPATRRNAIRGITPESPSRNATSTACSVSR